MAPSWTPVRTIASIRVRVRVRVGFRIRVRLRLRAKVRHSTFSDSSSDDSSSIVIRCFLFKSVVIKFISEIFTLKSDISFMFACRVAMFLSFEAISSSFTI